MFGVVETKKEIREATDTLLQALLSADDITKDQALAITTWRSAWK